MILELDFLVEPLDGRTFSVTLFALPQCLARVDIIFAGSLDFGRFRLDVDDDKISAFGLDELSFEQAQQSTSGLLLGQRAQRENVPRGLRSVHT